MLEEGVSDHRHEHMTMKTMPGPTFEMVEAKLLFQLLMSLLADPSLFDCGSQVAQIHLGWQVGKIILFLSRQALLADEPGLVTRKMLLTFVPYPLRRSIRRCAHGQQQIGLRAGLSSRFASSHFSIWHRPACLQPLPIEYPARAACGAAPELW